MRNKIEPSSRQVIENQLLARLQEDKSVVAILLNEHDLEVAIVALRCYPNAESKEMAKNFLELLNAAFPHYAKTP